MDQVTQKGVEPIEILKDFVSPQEVGKYYIKTELNRIFNSNEKISYEINKEIDSLNEKTFWRLLESLSFSLRLNWMFWIIGSEKFTWSKEKWLVGDITLTGMDPDIDKITTSEQVNRNPLKFREYLAEYFKNNPKQDTEGLEQFRNFDRNILYPVLTLRMSDNKAKMLDGSNRLMSLVQNGEAEIEAFVAREKNPEGKMRIGDSTFYLLRYLFERSGDEEKQAILTTTKRLLEEASDGKEAVKSYWVDHVRDEELKAIGKKLLELE